MPRMDLNEWMSRENINKSEAARRFGVSHTTVLRWASGRLLPAWNSLIVIKKVTGGDVTPDDFMPETADESEACTS